MNHRDVVRDGSQLCKFTYLFSAISVPKPGKVVDPSWRCVTRVVGFSSWLHCHWPPWNEVTAVEFFPGRDPVRLQWEWIQKTNPIKQKPKGCYFVLLKRVLLPSCGYYAEELFCFETVSGSLFRVILLFHLKKLYFSVCMSMYVDTHVDARGTSCRSQFSFYRVGWGWDLNSGWAVAVSAFPHWAVCLAGSIQNLNFFFPDRFSFMPGWPQILFVPENDLCWVILRRYLDILIT